MASLAEIRAKLKAQETRSERSGGDNAIFPHWNIPEGSTSVVRFLPDGDPNNTFFWAERLMIRLPFNGVKGDMNSKPVVVQVPCVEMWNETCPILTEVRTWFKDSSLEEMGRKYWKKRSYIFQGFVNENSLQEDNTPENPIRRFVISPSIFNLINAGNLSFAFTLNAASAFAASSSSLSTLPLFFVSVVSPPPSDSPPFADSSSFSSSFSSI